MSGGGPKYSVYQPPAPPQAQSPVSANFSLNGTPQSSQVYNSGTNSYNINSYTSPDQQAIQDQSTGFLKNLIPSINNAYNGSPEQLDAYKQAYIQPQEDALDRSYHQALGSAQMAANSRGMGDSVGFNDYLANQIERNKAQGEANIQASGEQAKYQLPQQALAPIADAMNLYTSALNGEQAQQQQYLSPSQSGAQLGANLYNNMAQLYAPQVYQRPPSFFGKLLGGY